MAAGRLIIEGWMPALDASANPYPGAKITFYENGTTDLTTVYADYDLTTPLTNPVIANSAGQFPSVFADASLLFSVKVETTDGALLVARDDVRAIGVGAGSAGGTVAEVGTVAEAEASDLSEFAFIRTASYATSQDGGGALYAAVDEEPSHEGKFESGGQWFEIADSAINIKSLGAVGDGVTDDSEPINNALAIGRPVCLPDGDYKAALLEGTTNFQRIRALGRANIIKCANGDLFTHSGYGVEIEGVAFKGESTTPSFTGHNVVLTGTGPRLINCASYDAYGRAVKATGNHVYIDGTCEKYATADATSDGFDIELGVSGTATLYHRIFGIRSAQATGGILTTDTGAVVVVGSQFGKLSVLSGTGPAGTGGGMYVGCRILGDMTLNLSGANFAACQIGAVNVVIGTGTSGTTFDTTTSFQSGHTFTNNGNIATPLIRSVGTGATGTAMILRYGNGSYTADLGIETIGVNFFTNRGFCYGHGRSLYWRDATDSSWLQTMTVSGANNNTVVGHTNGAAATTVASGTSPVSLYSGGGTIFQASTGYVRPGADNTVACGTASFRFSTVYAATGTINTSDETLKQDIKPIDDAVLDAWASVRKVQYRWRDAVAEKGDAARTHFGVIAQEVEAAFQVEGLNAFDYGVLCHDKWEAQEVLDRYETIPAVLFKTGKRKGEVKTPERRIEIMKTIPAGERYAVRPDEASALDAALILRQISRMVA